jgi:hypothetical protein
MIVGKVIIEAVTFGAAGFGWSSQDSLLNQFGPGRASIQLRTL